MNDDIEKVLAQARCPTFRFTGDLNTAMQTMATWLRIKHQSWYMELGDLR